MVTYRMKRGIGFYPLLLLIGLFLIVGCKSRPSPTVEEVKLVPEADSIPVTLTLSKLPVLYEANMLTVSVSIMGHYSQIANEDIMVWVEMPEGVVLLEGDILGKLTS